MYTDVSSKVIYNSKKSDIFKALSIYELLSKTMVDVLDGLK